VSETKQTKGSYSELLCSLSLAADLNMGQPMEHGLKTVWIATQIVHALALPHDDRVAVYYGGLLKDAG